MKNLITVLLSIFALTGCIKSDEYIAKDFSNHKVKVLFAPNSNIKDDPYYTEINAFILASEKMYKHGLEYVNPTSEEMATQIYIKWLEEADDETLIILTSSKYKKMVSNYANLISDQSILLYETNASDLPVSSFEVSGYGPAYLAGVAASILSNDKEAIFLGDERNFYSESVLAGFTDGLKSKGGEKVISTYLAEDITSNNKVYAARAFAAKELNENRKFILPIAGIANMGVYDFVNSDTKYFTASDINDQSDVSQYYTCSIVKSIGLLTSQYIYHWLDTESLPEYGIYSMTHGFTAFSTASNYKFLLDHHMDMLHYEAISKEANYLTNKPAN